MVTIKLGKMKSGALISTRLKATRSHNRSIFSCNSMNVTAVAGSFNSIRKIRNFFPKIFNFLKNELRLTFFKEVLKFCYQLTEFRSLSTICDDMKYARNIRCCFIEWITSFGHRFCFEHEVCGRRNQINCHGY